MATTGNNYHTRTDRFNRKKCQDNNKKTEFETTIPLNIINTHSPSLTVPRNRHDAKTNVGSLSENDFVQITTNQQLNIKPIMLKRRLWMFNHHHELHVLRLFYYIPNKKYMILFALEKRQSKHIQKFICKNSIIPWLNQRDEIRNAIIYCIYNTAYFLRPRNTHLTPARDRFHEPMRRSDDLTNDFTTDKLPRMFKTTVMTLTLIRTTRWSSFDLHLKSFRV